MTAKTTRTASPSRSADKARAADRDRRHGRAFRRQPRRRHRAEEPAGFVSADLAADVRSARLPAHGAEPGARRRGAARQRPEHRRASARHDRHLPGAGRRGVLGAHRRQPRVPHPPRQDAASAPAITATSSCCCAKARSPRKKLPNHPMRNFVECCLGGDPAIPEMTISGRQRAAAGRRAAVVHGRHLGESARHRHRRVLSRTTASSCAPGSKRSAAAPCRHPRRSATTPPPPCCAGWE